MNKSQSKYEINRRAKRKGISSIDLLTQETYEKSMLNKGFNFCISCKDWKEFGKNAGYCKSCCSERTRLKYDKDRQKAYILKKKYGLTVEQYENMRISQNYRCHICNTEESKLDRSLAVDHCHETLQVRGLLCGKCNRFLGQINDNVDTAKRLVSYLETFKKIAKNK